MRSGSGWPRRERLSVADGPVERDCTAVGIDPVLVRVVRVGWAGGEVDDVRVRVPPVVVSVPVPGWDLHDPGRAVGEVDLHDRPGGRRALAAVEENHSNIP